jgi:hypothetical protein
VIHHRYNQQAYDKFENDKFKQALKTLTLDNLPLSVCCRHSGDIDKDSVGAQSLF